LTNQIRSRSGAAGGRGGRPGGHGLGGEHITAANFGLDETLPGGTGQRPQFFAQAGDDRPDRLIGIAALGRADRLGNGLGRPDHPGGPCQVLQHPAFHGGQRQFGTVRPDQTLLARLQHEP